MNVVQFKFVIVSMLQIVLLFCLEKVYTWLGELIIYYIFVYSVVIS